MLGDIVREADRLRSRKERLRLARERNMRSLRVMLSGPRPQGDWAQVAFDSELEELLNEQGMLDRGEFPSNGVYDDLVVDGDHICDECINGHHPDCDARRPMDLGDCFARDCYGCCPNECPEHGLEREATKAGMKLREMFGGLVKRYFR